MFFADFAELITDNETLAVVLDPFYGFAESKHQIIWKMNNIHDLTREDGNAPLVVLNR